MACAFVPEPFTLDDLLRVHADTKYDIVLDDTFPVKTMQLMPGHGDWPIMIAEMRDNSILPLLTELMLGPNKEYTEIRVHGTCSTPHTVHAKLTNYMHGPSKAVLFLQILRAERG